jgi:hypothetical protein
VGVFLMLPGFPFDEPGNIQRSPVFAALRLGKTCNIEHPRKGVIRRTVRSWALNVECFFLFEWLIWLGSGGKKNGWCGRIYY